MRRLGLTLATLALLAGCGSRWPEENREAFMRSCVDTARKTKPSASDELLTTYCDCCADRLQEQYSLKEFEAIEARSVRENKPAMELVRVVEECAGRLR